MRKNKRLPGNAKKTPFYQLEKALEEWITDQNAKRLTLKEKYIVSKAKAVKDDLLKDLVNDGEELLSFKASKGNL